MTHDEAHKGSLCFYGDRLYIKKKANQGRNKREKKGVRSASWKELFDSGSCLSSSIVALLQIKAPKREMPASPRGGAKADCKSAGGILGLDPS